MGNINETIRGHVQRQFNLVKKSKKDYLVIDEAKKLTSLDEYPIDFKKLAVLFMLDVDKNGKFSSEDLMKFAEWCGSVTGHIKADQQSFKSELQAQCTLHMWKQINTARNGKEIFGDWFVRLFSVGHILKVPKYPNIHWVSVDTVSTIHELLSIKELYGIDCQQLIGLMQSVGEEKGLMSLDDEDLDDVIPIQVIHDFAVSFITGFLNMMSSFGFTREKYLTPTLLKESNNSANNSLSSPSNTSSPSNNSPVSVEGVGVGNGVGSEFKLTIKPEAFKLKDLSNNNNSTTITNNSSNNLDNNSSNNNTNSGKIVPSGFKLSLPVGKMNIPTNNNNTNNEQNISNKNATIKTEVKSQIMIPKLSMGISPTTIQNNNAPKSNDSETSGDDDYEDDHHFQKNNGNNNNNALDLQITPNTNVALKTISPNATVFLFDEQNNLEKLGERKGNFTSSDEEENFSEESDEEEYDDDDDIDINSPREAPKIHPALLQSQQQQQQQNFMPKPKISLPSLGNANNNNNNNGNEIPNNSSNSIKVNGIAMKKLKF